MLDEHYLKRRENRTVPMTLMAQIPDKEIQKVEVVNHQPLPETQKVEVINQPIQKADTTSHALLQRIGDLVGGLKFPEKDVQRVEITNHAPAPVINTEKVEFPDQSPHFQAIEKAIKDSSISVSDWGKYFAANPDSYLNVRLTDGKHFYRALDEIVTGVNRVKSSYIDQNGVPTVVKLNPDGSLPVPPTTISGITISGLTISGMATESNQINGLQLTQIVDAIGNAATISGGALNVNASFDIDGLATATNQTAQLAQISGLIGTELHTGLNALRTVTNDYVDPNNSVSTTLGIGATFSGAWTDTLNFAELDLAISTSHASVTDGLDIQWSMDGINVQGHDKYTINGTSSKQYSFPCNPRYYRVIYTNDGVAESNLVIQSILKVNSSKGSSHRLADALSGQDDAIVTKSLIAGFTTAGGGSIVDVKVNPSGAMQIDGTVLASQDGAWTVAATQSGNWHTAASQSGIWTVGATQSGLWTTAATQSGIWNVNATQSGTWTTAVTQSGIWSTRTQDGSGNAITSTGNRLDVNLPANQTVNVAQINGTTPSTNTGTADAGTQRVVLASNQTVPISVAAPTNTTTTAYAASLVVKASAGTLYRITGFNSKTTAQYCSAKTNLLCTSDEQFLARSRQQRPCVRHRHYSL